MSELISTEVITGKILFFRGRKVMLDGDLALLYGVPTKRLNEQVRRNKKRFPEDFMFQLTPKEKKEVVAICDQFKLNLDVPNWHIKLDIAICDFKLERFQ